MGVILGFFPVLLFLIFLFLLDHLRLVRINTLIICLIWGVACILPALVINNLTARWLNLDFAQLSVFTAPVVEEILKGMIVLYLIWSKRIGFMVDAAIYGFAAGAGFALAENLWFFLGGQLGEQTVAWVIRGFGTAIMHGGCTALLAIFVIGRVSRSVNPGLALLPGLFMAVILHSAYNHFPLDPLLQTLAILITLPTFLWIVFRLSNNRLQEWMEIEFSSEVELLVMIRKGEFRSTRAGEYLLSIKDRFTPETIVEMYCYIALYLELSIMAKRNLMFKETGFPIPQEIGLEDKLTELAYLRKQIGPLGEMALAPLIRMNYRSLWKLNQLKN